MTKDTPPNSPIARAVSRFEADWKAALEGGAAPQLDAYLTEIEQEQRPAAREALEQVESSFRGRWQEIVGETVQLPASSSSETEACYGEPTAVMAPGGTADTAPSNKIAEDETASDAPADSPSHQLPGDDKLGETAFLDGDGGGAAAGPSGNMAESPSQDALGETAFLDGDSGGRPSGTDARAGGVHISGYEIERELGRGGMGVVYLARQVGLNRLVALKMILAGGHASQDVLERFRAEGEAVAQLEHPNIVHIFDVGEADGFPYFSLEFVDGKPLSQQVSDQPQPPADAAEMIEALARAMHYAHERGIVHRDLKPENVLVTQGGIPKISDFGLVKRIECSADSSKTRTGTIMGTPSYMAPEQARAEKDVGPLADVYSLGSMLYKLLTGRPPFLGSNAMETVMQVLQNEPVPPTRLQPKIPRDLETICLKCLQKDLPKRYPDAEALADDLARFLRNEPIQARPVSLVERSWRWCLRNPVVAAASGAAALFFLALAIGGNVAAVVISQQKRIAVEAKELAEKNERRAEWERTQAEDARERAEHNADVARQQGKLAVDAFQKLTESVSDLRDAPATSKIKRDLLITALQGLRQVSMVHEDDARRADVTLAAVHQRMGQILIFLGQTADARKEYEEMDRIIEAAAAEEPGTAQSIRNRFISLSMLGDVTRLLNETQAAGDYYRQALSMMEPLAAADPDNQRYKRDLATAYMKLGAIAEPQEAHDYMLKALQKRQDLLDSAAENARFGKLRDVWTAHDSLGALNFSVLWNFEAALAHYQDCCSCALELLELNANSFLAKRHLAVSYLNLGRSKRRLGDDTAQAEIDKALQLCGTLTKADPNSLTLKSDHMLALVHAGRHSEAAALAEELLTRAPQNINYLYNVACCYSLCAKAIDLSLDGGGDAADSTALREQYVQSALDVLQTAIENGLSTLTFVEGDPEMEAAREHPRFREIIDAAKSAAAAPPSGVTDAP